jgi:sortase (surface protein transpeptidase)
MSIFRVIFELFVLYLLYKLVFDFIIPVYQTTKSVKQKMGEMQQKMNEQAKQQQASQFKAASKDEAPKSGKHDYIEFEEVK